MAKNDNTYEYWLCFIILGIFLIGFGVMIAFSMSDMIFETNDNFSKFMGFSITLAGVAVTIAGIALLRKGINYKIAKNKEKNNIEPDGETEYKNIEINNLGDYALKLYVYVSYLIGFGVLGFITFEIIQSNYPIYALFFVPFWLILTVGLLRTIPAKKDDE